jgi:hypothetical protein
LFGFDSVLFLQTLEPRFTTNEVYDCMEM